MNIENKNTENSYKQLADDGSNSEQQSQALNLSIGKGKLKIYIGNIAGVGKTYRMLQEAHELKSRGVDVAIGYIETHNRAQTQALLEGLEIIPRKHYKHEDLVIEEMDMEAIQKRKPKAVVVDEMAHSNFILMKNRKRYQDVIDLLNNGIDVICAFNIQHLESLNDLIAEHMGVKIYETIPDGFLDRADQIINIDISTEDMLDRLRSGKIYPEERIKTALSGFFQSDKIRSLRELALKEVASRLSSKVDPSEQILLSRKALRSDLLSQKHSIMLCYATRSHSQLSMIRQAARIARNLDNKWYLVMRDEEDNLKKQNHYAYEEIKLAKELGANFIQVKAADNYRAWQGFAAQHNINSLIIPSSYSSLLGGAKFWIFGSKRWENLIQEAKGNYHIIILDC